MPSTDGAYIQDTPFSDMEIFVGCSEFLDTFAQGATLQSSGIGDFKLNSGSVTAPRYQANVSMFLKRTGQALTAAQAQQQFGSAALGPSNPDGTSGYPPFTAAQLTTLKGPTANIPKGVRINSIDTIYWNTGGGPLVGARLGLYYVNFTDNTPAPVITTVIDGTVQNLNTTVRSGFFYKVNLPVPAPYNSFIITSGTQVIVTGLMSTSSGNINFYGVSLHCSHNFN